MGLGGRIILYSESVVHDPIARVVSVSTTLGANTFTWVVRTPWPDRGWEVFQLRRARRDRKADAIEQSEVSETIAKGIRVAELPRIVGTAGQFYVESMDSSSLLMLAETVKSAISENTRGTFWPMQLHIHARDQDIWTEFPYPAGTLYGRATFSVEFFGYGVATQTGVCDEMILALPEFKKVKADLETILGPLKQCVIWHG